MSATAELTAEFTELIAGEYRAPEEFGLLVEEFSDLGAEFGRELGSDRIDTKEGVIRGVKVLGMESRNKARVLGLSERDYGKAVDNTYFYTEDACRRAVALYENIQVFSDHLPFGMTEDGRRFAKESAHSNDDLVGWIKNVRFVPGRGIYGDLHYIKSHRMAGTLLEVASRNPSKFALSHEAFFQNPQLSGGRIAITEITSVDAVALISHRPGTNSGLFESAVGAGMDARNLGCLKSIRSIIEATPASDPFRQLLVEACDDCKTHDQKMTADLSAMEVGFNTQEPSHSDQIRGGLLAAMSAAIDKAGVDQLRAALKALGLTDSLSEAATGKSEVDPNALAAVVPAADPEVPAVEAKQSPEADHKTADAAGEEKPKNLLGKGDLAMADSEDEKPAEVVSGDEAKPEFMKKSDEKPESEEDKLKKLKAAESLAVNRENEIFESLTILKQNGVQDPDAVVIKAMVGLPKSERETFAKSLPKTGKFVAETAVPRSTSPKAPAKTEPVAESAAADKYKEPGSFAKAFRNVG